MQNLYFSCRGPVVRLIKKAFSVSMFVAQSDKFSVCYTKWQRQQWVGLSCIHALHSRCSTTFAHVGLGMFHDETKCMFCLAP